MEQRRYKTTAGEGSEQTCERSCSRQFLAGRIRCVPGSGSCASRAVSGILDENQTIAPLFNCDFLLNTMPRKKKATTPRVARQTKQNKQNTPGNNQSSPAVRCLYLTILRTWPEPPFGRGLQAEGNGGARKQPAWGVANAPPPTLPLEENTGASILHGGGTPALQIQSRTPKDCGRTAVCRARALAPPGSLWLCFCTPGRPGEFLYRHRAQAPHTPRSRLPGPLEPPRG